MKSKNLLLTLLLSSSTMVVAAQNDSICISNSSVSHEFVKAGNYKDAYLPWKVVIGTCPTLRYYTFTDGFSILKSFLATNTDRSSADYKKYFDELMDLHDARIKYIPEFLSKGTRITLTTDGALATKAIDYIQFAPSVDVNTAYSWLSQSVNAEQEKSSANALNFFLDMSGQKLKGDDTHKEQFIKDYMLSTQLADAAIASATKETTKTSYETVRSNLDAQFINSGVATCESLENIYAPKVEASKDNLDALKDIIKVMDMMGCRDNDAYQQASLHAYQIEPSADAALGCAAMAFKKGDISGAVKFFDEALKLEDDSNKKAETAYKAAVVLASKKQLSQARSYAQKAISYKENYGAPYILIATLYAGNYKWSDEPILNKCTFWAAIDKLQRAKSVDSSCTEEANKLIGQYSAYTPESKDLFMLGYKSGDRIAIGGWIGETVTVR